MSQSRSEPTATECVPATGSKNESKGSKTECVFADGTAILVSNFLASFIRTGDELLFPVELEAADAGTQIYIRNTNPQESRRDVFQAEIGYATQPRKDKRTTSSLPPKFAAPAWVSHH